MRVLLLTPFSCDDPTFISVFGGLGKAYRGRGWEVTAAGLSGHFPGAPSREEAPWGLRRRLGGVEDLAGLLRKTDWVHLHLIGNWKPSIPEIFREAGRAGVPVGVTFQDYNNPSLPRPGAQELAAMERALRGAAWITGLTRFVAREAAASLPSLAGRIAVVPNGLDLEERDAGASRAPRPRAPFALCVARLMLYKGIDVLLLAWKDVCERVPGVELVLCGPDPARGHFQALARSLGVAGRTRFFGAVDRKEMWGLMRACELFVLPSRHEAFGISALEAMACGKAVLATRAGGLPEFIADGKSGVLVPPKDADALRDALLSLLGDPGRRARLGAAARRAAAGYGWDVAAESYMALCAAEAAR